MAKTASYYDSLSPEEKAQVDAMINDQPSAESAAPQDWGEAVQEGVRSIPESGMSFGKNLLSAVMHPVETAKNLYGTVVGLGEKATGTEPNTPEGAGRQEKADAVINYYKSRYGSEEGFKNAIAQDPVGVLADFASVAFPAGKVMQGAGVISGMEGLANAGRTIAEVGTMAEPVNLATQTLVGAAKTPIYAGRAMEAVGEATGFKPFAGAGRNLLDMTEAGPQKAYQSAAKFSTKLRPDERAAITKTALENGIMPTRGGVSKLLGKISEANEEVTAKISGVRDAGLQYMNVEDVLKPFDDLIDPNTPLFDASMPMEAKNAYRQIRDQHMANLKSRNGFMTPEEAQVMKQSIYKELASAYSQTTAKPAMVKGKMMLARSLKEQIESVAPEVKHLNLKESEYLALLDEIEGPANRISNRDMLGLGPMLKGTLGYAAAGKVGAAAGVAAGMPAVQARLAIWADRLRRKGVKLSPWLSEFRLGLAIPQQIENAPQVPQPPYIEPAPEQKRPNALFAPILTL